MGSVALEGFGGGGASLNFKVIGNPQPSTAKENTIWIDTDRINNYYFSATQPENMADYDVWITTGTSNAVAFSATKKNPIMVYPAGVTQYIGGELVDKDTKIWQGGEWKELLNYLYVKGNECTAITGGWVKRVRGDRDGTMTKHSDSIEISIEGNAQLVASTPSKTINLTDINKIYFNVTEVVAGALMIIFSPTTNWQDTGIVQSQEAATPGVHYLDVSTLSGEYYIGVRLWGGSAAKIKYDKVWWE